VYRGDVEAKPAADAKTDMKLQADGTGLTQPLIDASAGLILTRWQRNISACPGRRIRATLGSRAVVKRVMFPTMRERHTEGRVSISGPAA